MGSFIDKLGPYVSECRNYGYSWEPYGEGIIEGLPPVSSFQAALPKENNLDTRQLLTINRSLSALSWCAPEYVRSLYTFLQTNRLMQAALLFTADSKLSELYTSVVIDESKYDDQALLDVVDYFSLWDPKARQTAPLLAHLDAAQFDTLNPNAITSPVQDTRTSLNYLKSLEIYLNHKPPNHPWLIIRPEEYAQYVQAADLEAVVLPRQLEWLDLWRVAVENHVRGETHLYINSFPDTLTLPQKWHRPDKEVPRAEIKRDYLAAHGKAFIGNVMSHVYGDEYQNFSNLITEPPAIFSNVCDEYHRHQNRSLLFSAKTPKEVFVSAMGGVKYIINKHCAAEHVVMYFEYEYQPPQFVEDIDLKITKMTSNAIYIEDETIKTANGTMEGCIIRPNLHRSDGRRLPFLVYCQIK